MTMKEYLSDPCRASSLPFRKAERVTVPENMRILHAWEFSEEFLREYWDEPYFRLIHPMQTLPVSHLPAGFFFDRATTAEFAAHINACYENMCVTAESLQAYELHSVYDPQLWLVIRDASGQIAASGIGELDGRIGEGVLEWIQVSKSYRRMGLGKAVVAELLRRMDGKAKFVTVSGRVHNPGNPEALYRSCGFSGSDIWHVLTRR